jgi:phospholipid-binding lipoprotein MlaA
MSGRRYFQFGLLYFLVFTFLFFSMMIGTTGFNAAIAAGEEAIESEATYSALKVNDPFEKFNREIFKFNDRTYFYVLKPTATVYAAIFPPGFRTSVRNGFHNLVFPSRFVNSVLQGKGNRAGTETARFVINSTMGLAGLFDVAETHCGIIGQEADFGQTLALWGVDAGPFLIIPLLGPSDVRDIFGYGVDSVMDPIFWIPMEWWVGLAVSAGNIINKFSLRLGEYEDFKKASFDPYISMREAYMHHRANQIAKSLSIGDLPAD